MRVIKRGILPTEKSQELTCRNCESVFKVLNSELTDSSQYNESFTYVNYPVCHHQVNCSHAK